MDIFFAKFGKILDVCKRFSKDLAGGHGNMSRRGVVPKFSDLEVIALALNARAVSIKRHGSRLSSRLPKRGSVSRRCSRNCATNTWSPATMQNKPTSCLPASSAKSVH